MQRRCNGLPPKQRAYPLYAPCIPPVWNTLAAGSALAGLPGAQTERMAPREGQGPSLAPRRFLLAPAARWHHRRRASTARIAGAGRLKSCRRAWGDGNMLSAFGGTEAGIGKVHSTPNELGEVLNEKSALPNCELGLRQPGPGGFGQTLLSGPLTHRRPTVCILL